MSPSPCRNTTRQAHPRLSPVSGRMERRKEITPFRKRAMGKECRRSTGKGCRRDMNHPQATETVTGIQLIDLLR